MRSEAASPCSTAAWPIGISRFRLNCRSSWTCGPLCCSTPSRCPLLFSSLWGLCSPCTSHKRTTSTSTTQSGEKLTWLCKRAFCTSMLIFLYFTSAWSISCHRQLSGDCSMDSHSLCWLSFSTTSIGIGDCRENKSISKEEVPSRLSKKVKSGRNCQIQKTKAQWMFPCCWQSNKKPTSSPIKNSWNSASSPPYKHKYSNSSSLLIMSLKVNPPLWILPDMISPFEIVILMHLISLYYSFDIMPVLKFVLCWLCSLPAFCSFSTVR